MKKISKRLETLILGMKQAANCPFYLSLAELTELFNNGIINVYNPYTGELMNPSEYVEEVASLLGTESKVLAPETNKSCQSVATSFPQNHQNECRCQVLERHRQNLLSLLCRVLRDAPEYKLRPSELAVENVGDLSSLSQETRAYLYMRMVPERLSRTATSDILRARPCSRCPYVSKEAVK